MTIYLDCNATTPIDPRVRDEVVRFLDEEFGNAGSRTHTYGTRAKEAVENARRQVASTIGLSPAEVIFTSGATESNNLAILGLAEFGERTGRKHLITSQIEHKAVLEPMAALEKRGFEVTYLPPNDDGRVTAEQVEQALRDDTLLVSVMHANNETGIIQPIEEIAKLLDDQTPYFHVDAAQGFGKDFAPLRSTGIDLISISGHKLFAPKGVGALLMRRKNYEQPPLQPLVYGGGQERKLRPGTLPVPLIVGLGLAAELAEKEETERRAKCRAFRETALKALAPLEPYFNGAQEFCQPHVLNLAVEGVDQEAWMVALKDHIAISNGSACTTSSKKRHSHVLVAMNAPKWILDSSVRISWCHITEQPDWEAIINVIASLKVR